jgi:hypothetical protein
MSRPSTDRDEHGSPPVDVHRQTGDLRSLAPARRLPRLLDSASPVVEHVTVKALADEYLDRLAVTIGEPGIDDDLAALDPSQVRQRAHGPKPSP